MRVRQVMHVIFQEDINAILSHRYDQGADLWTTPDHKLLKGAPFTTLECATYLIELGMSQNDEIIKQLAELIFSVWKDDGRFRISPNGGLYPCQSALAWQVLCRMGYASDERLIRTCTYFLNTQEDDGGWICKKYSFGKGEETMFSTPYTTLLVLDALRFYDIDSLVVNRAVDFLLNHWKIKRPISPCHYGIGTLFMQVEYPFRGYNIFYYVYILSFYETAIKDSRFKEAFEALSSTLQDGKIVVQRVVPKLAKLSFCQKGKISELATKHYLEIVENLKGDRKNEASI